MKTLSAAAAVFGLLLAVGPANAQTAAMPPADAADVQCFALFAVVSGQMGEDAPERVGLAGGMMYHLGRLEGRTPDVDWLDRIGVYLTETSLEALDAERPRCARSLTDKGAAMVAWGEKIQMQSAAP